MHCEEPVQAVIWHCLNNYDFKNAIFLAERLCAEIETDETIFLLATCYYRTKQIHQAYWLLHKKSRNSPQCRLLEARCAYELKDYTAAEYALMHKNFGTFKDFERISKDFGDIACFALQLIAQICLKNERNAMAAKALKKALKLNPFMWQAFEELCKMGENIDIKQTFQIKDIISLEMCTSQRVVSLEQEIHNQTPRKFFENFSGIKASTPVCAFNEINSQSKGGGDECEQFQTCTSISQFSPSFGVLEKKQTEFLENFKQLSIKDESFTTTTLSGNVGGAKFNIYTQAGNILTRKSNERTGSLVKALSPICHNLKFELTEFETESLKENNLLYFTANSPRKLKQRGAVKEINVNNAEELVGNTTYYDISFEKTGNTKCCTCHELSSTNFESKLLQQLQSAEGLMNLLQILAEGFKLFAKFQCRLAISHFKANVPEQQQRSSWLQSLLAIAYYESQDYESAASIFKNVHTTEPFRFENMDLYSNCLWQLQQAHELTTLAHDLINCNRQSPISWCVMGNCFSLQNDHELSIKFLKRSLQVDPDYICGYTLLGHEYMFHEELDRARDCFNAAVARDTRSYKAWYGLGTTYAKQQKCRLALLYFERAFKINSQNSNILVHMAEMQHAMKLSHNALRSLNLAISLDTKNLLAIFQRAKILYDLKRFDEALKVLNGLQELAPNESVVFSLLGNIHKALGKDELALMYFSWAVDRDAKKPELPIKKSNEVLVLPKTDL